MVFFTIALNSIVIILGIVVETHGLSIFYSLRILFFIHTLLASSSPAIGIGFRIAPPYGGCIDDPIQPATSERLFVKCSSSRVSAESNLTKDMPC